MGFRSVSRGFPRAWVILWAIVWTSALAWLAPVASAQDDAFRPGQRVEYKDRSYPESWQPGTIVRVMPDYRQVLVRWDPRDDYPSYTRNGASTYEQAYAMSDVRALGAAPAGAAAAASAQPANAAPPIVAAQADVAAAGTPSAAGPPLTPAELIGYMRAHAYAGHRPTHDANACRALIALIKARGVVAPLQAGQDDLAPFADNGCFGAQDTDVMAASRANIGAPVERGWLAGTWLLYVVGGTVDTLHADGWVYRQNESIAKLGFLKIVADGTYTWKVAPADPPEKYVHGRWRPASATEMALQGGAGIVLQHAAEGADWIVFKYMDATNPAERIEVEHLQALGAYRRIGWRSGQS